MKENLQKIDLNILENITDLNAVPSGAVNIRLNGQPVVRHSTPNVSISSNPENNGLLVEVKPHSKKEVVHVPVILTTPGLKEVVYNTFIIGENAEAEIIAGCGIHNTCQEASRHDGVHEIIVKKGASLRYVEKHYGAGLPGSKKFLNPSTVITIEEGGQAELEMVQIAGVDDTNRYTKVVLAAQAQLKITERILTQNEQTACSEIQVFLAGENSNAQILSRGVAQDNSKQVFKDALIGQANATGHLECDALIMDQALIQSIPELRAENSEAVLTHEAAIGKIAGEQLIKLMSLGLSEQEAENTILKSFLN